MNVLISDLVCFNFSISPSNEYSGWRFPSELTGLISLPKSPFGDSKVFSSTRLSFPYGPIINAYMTTGKTIALTLQTFVIKVMSLLFNMLSRFVVTFLPRSKCLLISWLQSLSTQILELKKIKSVTVSTFPPSVCHEYAKRKREGKTDGVTGPWPSTWFISGPRRT